MVVNGKEDWFRKVEYQMSRLRSDTGAAARRELKWSRR